MVLFICCQSMKCLHEGSLKSVLIRWPFWELQAKLFLWLQDGFNSNFTPLAFIYTSDRQQKVTENPEELQQCVPEVAEALQTQQSSGGRRRFYVSLSKTRTLITVVLVTVWGNLRLIWHPRWVLLLFFIRLAVLILNSRAFSDQRWDLKIRPAE